MFDNTLEASYFEPPEYDEIPFEDQYLFWNTAKTKYCHVDIWVEPTKAAALQDTFDTWLKHCTAEEVFAKMILCADEQVSEGRRYHYYESFSSILHLEAELAKAYSHRDPESPEYREVQSC